MDTLQYDKDTQVSNIHWTSWEPHINEPMTKFAIEMMFRTGTFRYVVCSLEECPKTGRDHWQCYAQLTRKKRLGQLWKSMSPWANNIVPEYSNPCASQKYCNNPEKPGFKENIINLGIPKQPGKRKELQDLAEDVRAGTPLREVADQNPELYIKYHHGIKSLRSTIRKPRKLDRMPLVIVHIGPTGSGKSKTVFDHAPDDLYVWGPEMGKWWQEYDGQEEVLMDEFRGQLPFAYILRLLDRYPMKVEMKGGSSEMLAHTFNITSPVHPSLWYSDLHQKEGRIDQLKRRITEIWEHTDPTQVPADITEDPWPVPDLGLLPGQSQFSNV